MGGTGANPACNVNKVRARFLGGGCRGVCWGAALIS
eukprot:COSAG01_NODE_34561_length_545_cov_1.659193_1_plen_35_part_10